MEQNKLENEFRNKLNQREITPNENSWDRLDAMLSLAEDKKKIRSYGWIYIAASILGFAFLGTFYFNQFDKDVTVKGNEVVIKNNQKVVPIQKNRAIVTPNPKTESTVVISEVKKTEKNPQDLMPTIKNQNQVAQNSNSLIPNLDNKQSNQKIEQIASSIINDNTVDEMLAAVQIKSKSDNSKTVVKVNPKTLLSQVDGEIELSFREKVINKVNKNYQTVKVALANRNQE